MEFQLEKRYPLDIDVERAWTTLGDVPKVAGCMPGAALTEQVDATHYKGNVKIKVGPASAIFGGEITVVALDATTHRLQLLGRGSDRGGSTASLDLTATVEPGNAPANSVLVGSATMIVNGKFAQFGGRMMGQVSELLLAQFVENFRVEAAKVPPDAIAFSAAPATVTVAPQTNDTAASDSASDPPIVAVAPSLQPRTSEMNGLAIVWGLVKSWFAGLIGKRA